MADFNHDGIPDLAVLTADGVSIYLGNGKGGFSPPGDLQRRHRSHRPDRRRPPGNGQLDLLVGNAYGDVLILVGNGDGTFRPFEPVKAAVALAVADLTGNGVLDFVFADQSLNRVRSSTARPARTPTAPRSSATSPPACWRPAPSCWRTSTATASPT